MALIDTATLVPGAGNFFTNPTPTDTPPADLRAITTPWVNMGHTSVEDILGFDSEGGEKTVLATLQNSAHRTIYSNRTETISLTLQQFDADSLKLFFGSNMSEGGYVSGTSGPKWLHVPGKAQATVCSFLAVFVDGENIFAIHLPKCEILRGSDNMDFSDTENLAGLPIKITPLQLGTNDYTMSVTPLGTV